MKVSRLVERPVLSNPKDILVNSILEAAEDHYVIVTDYIR